MAICIITKSNDFTKVQNFYNLLLKPLLNSDDIKLIEIKSESNLILNLEKDSVYRVQRKGGKTFSVKSEMIYILNFIGYKVS